MNANKVETYLHHVFADCRLEMDMTAPNGKEINATEWYIVDFESIQEAINEMTTQVQLLGSGDVYLNVPVEE